MASTNAPQYTVEEAAAFLLPNVCDALALGLEPPLTLGSAIQHLTDFHANPSTGYTKNHSEFDDMCVIHKTTMQVLHLLLKAEQEWMADIQKKLHATRKTVKAHKENLAQLIGQMNQLMSAQV